MKERLLSKALFITATRFKDKYDKGGKPYFLHCMHVFNALSDCDIDTQIAGLMHDIIEDTDICICDLQAWGFSMKTIELIRLLKHEKDVEYMDYIKKICTNTFATRIKLEDLKHNSDITRLKGLTKKDFDRLEKYCFAYTYLSNV